MTYRRLVWRNVTRHPARAGLVVAFAALSLFVFGFLRSVITSLSAVVASAGDQRVVVSSSVSLFLELPASYREQIQAIEGVESVSRWSWFGAYYRDRDNFFPSMAVDMDTVFRQFPELQIPKEQLEAALGEPRACIVGQGLVDKFGFEVGQSVPMIGTINPTPDGSPWVLNVRGVYRTSEPTFPDRLMFVHWKHLDEVRAALPERQGAASAVSLFRVRLRPGVAQDRVADAIEARYAAGPQRVHAQTESAFRAERIQAFGNLPALLTWIGGAVFLAMLLSVVNAMGIVARERAREVGVLKALGFSDGTAARLVVWESVALVGTGGIAGVGVAWATQGLLRRLLADRLPIYAVAPATIAVGIAIAAGIGLLGGLAPAIRLHRLRPIEVFREEV